MIHRSSLIIKDKLSYPDFASFFVPQKPDFVFQNMT